MTNDPSNEQKAATRSWFKASEKTLAASHAIREAAPTWEARQCGIYAGTKLIACTGDDGDEDAGQEQLDRARFIARACNAHADLLATLEALVKDYADASVGDNDKDVPTALTQARAAIAKAT